MENIERAAPLIRPRRVLQSHIQCLRSTSAGPNLQKKTMCLLLMFQELPQNIQLTGTLAKLLH